MKLLIFGSRDINQQQARTIIEGEIQKYDRNTLCILTAAEPGGVCELARKIAQEKELPLMLFFKQLSHAQGMYDYRSKQACKYAEYAIFLHNGTSKGTANEVKIAQKMKVPYAYFKLEAGDGTPADSNEWNLFENFVNKNEKQLK